jgi:putative ABC transport system ATP-binding protein
MKVLEAAELYRFYHTEAGETFALRGVSFSIFTGEVVAVLGPSGSGKSTLFAALAGLDDPTGGHVEIMGHRMSRTGERERSRLRATFIGFYPQSGNLLEHLTVRENIRLQAVRPTAPMPIDDLMIALNLDQLGDALPERLSGGERARAGLAVALSNDPVVLLADEPTAEVDRQTETLIFELLERRRQKGQATLLASHSAALARRADRLLILQDGRLTGG